MKEHNLEKYNHPGKKGRRGTRSLDLGSIIFSQWAMYKATYIHAFKEHDFLQVTTEEHPDDQYYGEFRFC